MFWADGFWAEGFWAEGFWEGMGVADLGTGTDGLLGFRPAIHVVSAFKI